MPPILGNIRQVLVEDFVTWDQPEAGADADAGVWFARRRSTRTIRQ
jgi:hypothetical protein